MASCAAISFGEPDDFASAIRMAPTELTVTGNGQFRARLVDINLNRLWMQRFTELLARVTHSGHASGETIISFTTRPGPPVFWAGAELKHGCILRHGEGQDGFQRLTGPTGWGAISLPVEAMVTVGACHGRDLAPPLQALTVTPPAGAMGLLRDLHAAIAKVAEDRPATLADPEAVRGMEQSVLQAVAICLDKAKSATDLRARQQQAVIMRRFRRALESHRDQPVYIPELCAEIGVSDRALRLCCQAQLGMGPHRYLLLRRMHLARRALLGSPPGGTTVTATATRFGFWQFGRFAKDYKTLFGELPSATLARLPA